MGSARTFVIERLRPLSGQRPANHLYTPNCEEPESTIDVYSQRVWIRNHWFSHPGWSTRSSVSYKLLR